MEILLLVTLFHFFPYFVFILFYCCISTCVRNKRGRLEIFEAYFCNLFDTPSPSPSSSIMGDETRNNHEKNRRIMYELLHPTQNSVSSCIMFLLVTSFHFFPYFILFYCCMSTCVRNKRGRLEFFEAYFCNLFDTPSPSPSSDRKSVV